ncbi:MarR family winged helix-turn-helix transcriptional regulator [Gloeocapsopsis dulcis]|uniref:MarR family transcriptional regulator n=2 Tax=Gloeocapsopsis TaxID=693222 RepID=A0A6N8FUZ8_9CHRO|nr:MarR family winged helix-turn-helix transcriptional regulator [Gloeocapsopsis dulcis]MUL36145.1 MarR family transcriptional regulator [Gloeocapsopsis dulcis AAB1 = 1H9]WNN91378.1 MarR family winged helix-turn-helix transcriptional regulator [Gloeocapsopsis dulcis]
MVTQTITPSQCAADIMTVIPAMTRFLRTEIRHHGEPHLSLSQLRVLYFLQRKPQSSLSEVADYLDVTRPTMSGIVERLVQRGLVHRMEDLYERRRIALTLTIAGVTEMERVYGATLASVASRLEGLSNEQRNQVMAGLSILSNLFTDS